MANPATGWSMNKKTGLKAPFGQLECSDLPETRIDVDQ